jgi:hypothetical protein
MTIIISEKAREKSTFVIGLEFFDENGDYVVPNSITWKLTDENALVINSRTAETETPDSAIDIVLSGNDLAIAAGITSRVLLVQAPYDSSLGSGLPNNEEYTFEIDDLVNIT